MKFLNSKRIIVNLFFILFSSYCFSYDVVASTSWTAAFADLAGVDNIKVIAPANLKHPPEYEITVSDISAISNSDFFIFAGFERMMKTLGTNTGNTRMIQIQCDNSLETVKKNAKLISSITGTEKESLKRVEKYENCLINARKKIKEKGLYGAKVLCHKHQVYLAKELGFNIAGTFGPGPVTSKQIADGKNGNYDLIIDNIHNPVGKTISEVAPKAEYIIWRNFPENVGNDSLLNVIKENINFILNL